MIRVLGILGAIDPHAIKVIGARAAGNAGAVVAGGAGKHRGDDALPPSSSEEFYPAFAIEKLIRILLDQSLSSYHQMVVQVVALHPLLQAVPSYLVAIVSGCVSALLQPLYFP